jgi:hypothetical protein
MYDIIQSMKAIKEQNSKKQGKKRSKSTQIIDDANDDNNGESEIPYEFLSS